MDPDNTFSEVEQLAADWISSSYGSTKTQRRALRRLGMSEHFIKRYCQTKTGASQIINEAIRAMTVAKQNEHR